MQRAHLIVNPRARLVTPDLSRAVASALTEGFSLTVSETAPGIAGADVARRAVRRGTDLVVAFGGDGLVNEVVNGLAGTGTALGIVPGGTMNVLARDLGVPRRPLEAARRLVALAGVQPPVHVRLGRANGRWFTFSCGCGFDAEVAALVNGHERAKHRLGETYFYAAALATLTRSYAFRGPFLEIEGGFGRRRGVMAIALAGRPYAYFAGRPIRLGPAPATSTGLSLFVVRTLRLWRVPEYAAGALLNGRLGSGAELLHDVGWVRVRSEARTPVHVDGERLAPARIVEIGAVEDALLVLA